MDRSVFAHLSVCMGACRRVRMHNCGSVPHGTPCKCGTASVGDCMEAWVSPRVSVWGSVVAGGGALSTQAQWEKGSMDLPVGGASVCGCLRVSVHEDVGVRVQLWMGR